MTANSTYAELTKAVEDGTEDFSGLLTADLGGYRLKSFKEAGGEETLRFEAVLTKDGKDVLTVSNDGHGGAHRYAYDRTKDGFDEFVAFAEQWEQESGYPFGGTKVDPDSFINHLTLCATINRARSIAVIHDDMNPFDYRDGRYLSYKAPWDLRDALAGSLAAHKDAKERNYRVWSRETWKFEPVL